MTISDLMMLFSDEQRSLIQSIKVGPDDSLDSQLITKSKQANIVEFTPKDALNRFGNIEQLKTWRSKDRTMHWLVGPENDLAGLIWYGSAPFPLPNIVPLPKETFAIRLYDGYTGKGLAYPFMKASLAIYVNSKQDKAKQISPIWLQTDITNSGAIHVYHKFGYQTVAEDKKRVTMVLPLDKIKQIVFNA